MHLNGINQSTVKVTLRNPLDYTDQLDYYIVADNSQLAYDWVQALKNILQNNNQLEKNFCFLGFPDTARDLKYLINELNLSINVINNFFTDYKINENYTLDNIQFDLEPNQELLNILHNHFEILQGTVENLSSFYRRADHETKYAIRQINNICHEIESFLLSKRKQTTNPEWIRPSQITTFLQCPRYTLLDEHRELFLKNGYDRRFGHVYMHWTQIGKTLFEVFRDEGAPTLTKTICEAITELKYFSGEFDIEWGRDIIYGDDNSPWHTKQQDEFTQWLVSNNTNSKDPTLSLGYLPIGKIDLIKSFGTEDQNEIRKMLSDHLDIYKIQIDNQIMNTYEYCWSDPNYKQQQIDKMRPGYDHSSRG